MMSSMRSFLSNSESQAPVWTGVWRISLIQYSLLPRRDYSTGTSASVRP
jgi:hypothetical protein